MANDWNAPPTPEELEHAWSKPPTEEEIHAAEHAAEPVSVGAGETYLNRTTDAIPLGRPAVNLGAAAVLQSAKHLFGTGEPGVHFTPEAKAELVKRGEPVDEHSAIPDFIESYRNVRDTRNERTDIGSKQNPWAARFGTGTGLLLSLAAPLPKVTVGGKTASALATDAAYGGTFALTHGKADLTRGEVGQAAKDLLGVDELASAGKNLAEGNFTDAALETASAGVPGALFAGRLVRGAARNGAAAIESKPGQAVGKYLGGKVEAARGKVRDFAEKRAVKATEPDLATYRMLESQGRVNDLGRDLLKTKVVPWSGSLDEIGRRAGAVREARGADIADFLDNLDKLESVRTDTAPILAAKHGEVPVQKSKFEGFDFVNEPQTTLYGGADAPFTSSQVVPKARMGTETVMEPTTVGYEPQTQTDRYITSGFNKRAAADRIEKRMMPDYEDMPGRGSVEKRLKQELNRLRRYRGGSDSVPFKTANDIKGALSDSINWKDPSQRGNNQLLKQLRGALNQEMEQQADDMLKANDASPDVMEKYRRAKELYGNMEQTSNNVEDALTRRERNRMFSPSDHGMGIGAGLATGNPVTGAATAIANKVVRERGSAMAARAADAVASLDFGVVERAMATAPEKLGAFGPVFADAYRRGGPRAALALDYALTKQMPEYRKMKEALGNSESESTAAMSAK